jgi:hypothetical protein
MSTGAVIAIVVVIVVVIAVVAVVAMEMRRRRLRSQFGPEYDRLVTELGSRRKAEAELSARQRRVAKLDIRPLTREETARYLGEWNAIQERFVDTPGQSVEQASALVTAVMRLRGYPADDQNEAMEALSVEHGPTLSRYREARLTSERARLGSASTDDLRNAMLQYRALFEELAARPQRDSDLETGRVAQHADTTADGTAAADSAPAGDMPASSAPVSAAPVSAAPADTAGPADNAPPNSDGTGGAVSPQRSTRG